MLKNIFLKLWYSDYVYSSLAKYVDANGDKFRSKNYILTHREKVHNKMKTSVFSKEVIDQLLSVLWQYSIN